MCIGHSSPSPVLPLYLASRERSRSVDSANPEDEARGYTFVQQQHKRVKRSGEKRFHNKRSLPQTLNALAPRLSLTTPKSQSQRVIVLVTGQKKALGQRDPEKWLRILWVYRSPGEGPVLPYTVVTGEESEPSQFPSSSGIKARPYRKES